MSDDTPEPTSRRNGLVDQAPGKADAHAEAVAFLERQLEADAPNLDAATRRKLASMGAAIAKRSAEKASAAAPGQGSGQPESPGRDAAAPAPEPAQTVQLDFWESGRRATPNALVRSALFPVLHPTQKEDRRFLDQERVYSVAGIEVFFTGKQFDQSDLDVYLELLNMARPYPLGTPIQFSAYALLKALGLPTGGSNHARLHSVLIRLRGGTVDITDHSKRYFGGLIEGGIRDEITMDYEITINPKFAVLFGYGMWATIDSKQRRALGRNATAKALHAYYSTHAGPSAHRYETLAGVAGLSNRNPRQSRADIIKAHELMKTAGFLSGYDAQADTITPLINHTPSQNRALVKKAVKVSGKGKRRNQLTHIADLLPGLPGKPEKK
jgi:hypothetical protein